MSTETLELEPGVPSFNRLYALGYTRGYVFVYPVTSPFEPRAVVYLLVGELIDF